MELQPLYDRILVKRQESETKSKGGIVLPGESQDKNNLCTVVAVGEGRLNDSNGHITPLRVEPGHTVMIGKWSGDEAKVDGEELLIIREADVLAIVRG